MLREIKFRGFTKKGQQMLDLKKMTAFAVDPTLPMAGLFIPFDEDVVLMQFTGLKDKNGTDIYEGDIIKVNFGGISSVFEVVWNEHGANFSLIHAKRDGDKYGVYTRNISLKEVKEIIGNRFQNPELL